jgi:cyclopropane-fatty-acyl-phospholipid synthase
LRFSPIPSASGDHSGEDCAEHRVRIGAGPGAKIFLLTHLRYLGYNFNPISFYYCFDRDEKLHLVLAEVNNTFGETQNYWLSPANELASSEKSTSYEFAKAFHVSPFISMDCRYRWTFTPTSDSLVAQTNVAEKDEALFDSTLRLERRSWSAPSLRYALLHFPCATSPDLVTLVRLAVRNLDRVEKGNRLFSVLSSIVDLIRHRFRGNNVTGSRRNFSHHCDLGNDFYRLFLDSTMAYSCAYYETAGDSLEQAQLRKFDRICRKLRLRPSDQLLEIGTGWGGFAGYAAKNCGCRITTTTISKQQHEYARELCKSLGAAGGRITLLLDDYRNLLGQFDKLVRIEMFEAVGLQYYHSYFSACDRLLKPHGAILLQSITMNEQNFPACHKRCDWIQKFIFPGAELASLAEVLASIGRCTRLSVHHAETLKAWRERFLARADQVKNLGFDSTFLRMWEYYLAYCEGSFREGYVGDVQLTLRKQKARLPLSWMPRLTQSSPVASFQ